MISLFNDDTLENATELKSENKTIEEKNDVFIFDDGTKEGVEEGTSTMPSMKQKANEKGDEGTSYIIDKPEDIERILKFADESDFVKKSLATRRKNAAKRKEEKEKEALLPITQKKKKKKTTKKKKTLKPRGDYGRNFASNREDTNRDMVSEMLNDLNYWNKYLGNPAKTPDEVAFRINDFFQHCEEVGRVPTVEKLALALGTNYMQLWRMEHQNRYGEVVANMITHAKTIIATMDAELAQIGKIQPVIYIFRAKNFYGMKDQVDIQTSVEQPLGEKESNLKEKYKDLIDVQEADIEEKE